MGPTTTEKKDSYAEILDFAYELAERVSSIPRLHSWN